MRFVPYIKVLFLGVVVFTWVLPGVSSSDVGKHQSHGKEESTILNDPAIFAILDQLNAYDIEMATMALAKGQSQSVKDLANMIVSDHLELQRQARVLAAKLGIAYTVPTDNHHVREHQRRVAELDLKSGTDFDDTYLRHETRFSQKVVHTVEHELIPAAHHDELKQFLSELLPELKRHLSHMTHGGEHPHMH